MRSRPALGHHPIHPMLIALPIGLFLWTLAADVFYLASDQAALWYHVSFWTSIAGILSALIAALPGLMDYAGLKSDPMARHVATWHMVINVMVVTLFVVAACLMARNAALTGVRLGCVVGLHVIGCGLLSLSGWLGGELVYRHRVAVLEHEEEYASAGGRES